MAMGTGKGFPKERVMLLGICSMGRVEILWLVAGFRNSQGLSDPVNDGVGGMEPGESEDDVFSSTAHDVEEMLLSNLFNICVEGASIVNCTSFVCNLIYIVNGDGGGEFLSGELVFPDKLLVNARDISTGVH